MASTGKATDPLRGPSTGKATDPLRGPSTWQGRVVDGRYTLEALLGTGGMGVVYRARHALTGAEVALKLMHPHIAAMPDVAARFLAEARAPAAIGHPGIVKVTDAGKTSDGELYLVMELLQGETLRARLEHGKPSRGLALQWATSILDALGAAHAAGIVHRDLKPENVFVVPDGTIRLLDFGIAKIEAAGASATATGSVMGTAEYMSPEQLRDTSKVDQRADLWALAVILFEMLSGRRPFEGASAPDVVVNILSKPAPTASGAIDPCTPALDAFFARAFGADPRARFANASEMTTAIAALAAAEVQAPAISGSAEAIPATASAPLPLALGPTTLASASPASSLQSAADAAANDQVTSSTMRSEYNPLLQVHAAPPAPPPPAPSPARRGLPTAAWVGIGLFGLAAISGVIAIVVTAAEGEPQPVSTAPTHRTPAPAKTHPAESDDALCERACEELERCTNVSGTNCRAECGRNADYRACVKPLKRTDCRGAATCAIGGGCSGKIPQGHSTCKQAAECEFACTQHKGNAVACACNCVHEMAPEKAIELAANNLCAVTNCNSECKAPASALVCGLCMTQHCRAPNQACLAH